MCVTWVQKYTLCGCLWEKNSDLCNPNDYCWGSMMVFIHSNLQTCKECWKRGDKRVDEAQAQLLPRMPEYRRQRPRIGKSKHRARENPYNPQIGPEDEERSKDADSVGASNGPGKYGECSGETENTKSQNEADKQAPMQQNAEHTSSPPQQDRKTFSDQDNVDKGPHTSDKQSQEPLPPKEKQHIVRGHRKSKRPTRKSTSRPRTPKHPWRTKIDLLPEDLLDPEYCCDLSRPCEPVKSSSVSRDYRAKRKKTDWHLVQGEYW